MRDKTLTVVIWVVVVLFALFLLKWVLRLATAVVVIGVVFVAGLAIVSWLQRRRGDR